MTPVGYSGTPLAKKLGLQAGMRVWANGMPPSVRAEIETIRPDVVWQSRATKGLDAAHVFVTSRAKLARHLEMLRSRIASTGMIWVSWPKKSSGVPSEVSEDTVREVALPLGLVDTKVCAVDDTWSGLKLVIRKALR